MTKMDDQASQSLNSAWEKKARRLVKATLVQQEVSLSQLVERLNEIGVSENASNLSNKISRGKFRFSFFLQIMEALEVERIDLSDF